MKKKTKEFVMASYKRTSKAGSSSALSNSEEKEANTEVSLITNANITETFFITDFRKPIIY